MHQTNQVRHVVHRWLALLERGLSRGDSVADVLIPGVRIPAALWGSASVVVRAVQLHPGDHGLVGARVNLEVDCGGRRLERLHLQLDPFGDHCWPRIRAMCPAAAVGPGTSSAPSEAVVPNHRIAATMYGWLALMEGNGAAECARELATDDVLVTGISGTIVSGVADLVPWISAQQDHIARSCHHTFDLTVSGDNGPGHLSTGFRWQGLTNDGQAMVAVTRHRWKLRDSGDSYARIASMHIIVEEPFTLTDATHALNHLEGG